LPLTFYDCTNKASNTIILVHANRPMPKWHRLCDLYMAVATTEMVLLLLPLKDGFKWDGKNHPDRGDAEEDGPWILA
jgi:hypothetical protein